MTHTKYFTPNEVAQHNGPDDCWVSFLGDVYDITPLLQANSGVLTKPLYRAAGTDISHWFDPATRDVKTYVNPSTNVLLPYYPQGRFLHCPPTSPASDWDDSFETPWWKNMMYYVGKLSQRTRFVRLKNVLTSQEDQLEVPVEETIEDIQDEYLRFNKHAASYTWRVMKKLYGEWVFVNLDMRKTLAENGVTDESEEFERLAIDCDFYTPVLHLYFNDDLTVA